MERILIQIADHELVSSTELKYISHNYSALYLYTMQSTYGIVMALINRPRSN